MGALEGYFGRTVPQSCNEGSEYILTSVLSHIEEDYRDFAERLLAKCQSNWNTTSLEVCHGIIHELQGVYATFNRKYSSSDNQPGSINLQQMHGLDIGRLGDKSDEAGKWARTQCRRKT